MESLIKVAQKDPSAVQGNLRDVRLIFAYLLSNRSNVTLTLTLCLSWRRSWRSDQKGNSKCLPRASLVFDNP